MKEILAPMLLALSCLPAQTTFQANSFLPDDYRNFVSVDLKALRDSGIWEELESSAVGMLFGRLEQETGFPLAALDRFTQVGVFPSDPESRSAMRVFVLEGNQALAVPNSVAQNQDYQREKIGDHEVMRAPGDWVFVQPRPEVQVLGHLAVLQDALTGGSHAGRPCADILSLQSARQRRLVEFAFDLTAPVMQREVLAKLFEDCEWPEGDAPHYLYGRLHDLGDEDDPHIVIEVVLRHVKAGDGLATTEKALDSLLQKVAANPEAVMARPLLTAIERSRDRGDLILKLDLGRARDAAGRIAMMAVPLLLPVPAQAQAAPAPALAPAPAPAPEKKKQ